MKSTVRVAAGALAAALVMFAVTTWRASVPPESPAGTRWSALALGDFGHPPKASRWWTPQIAVGDAMAAVDRASPVDALLLLGDHFYPDGLREGEVELRVAQNLVAPFCHFFDLGGELSSQVAAACRVPASERHAVPVLAVLGNHDYKSPESPGLQQEEIPRYVRNFSLRAGAARVVETGVGVSLVLFDSNTGRRVDELPELQAALREARGPWRVVVTHHPLDETGKTERLRETVAAAGVPVQLWVAGHEHNLQLTRPGVPGAALQVVSGAGSHPTPSKYPVSGTEVRFQTTGFARIDLVGEGEGERLRVSLIGSRRIPLELWRPTRVLAGASVDRAGNVELFPSP